MDIVCVNRNKWGDRIRFKVSYQLRDILIYIGPISLVMKFKVRAFFLKRGQTLIS
jgi:hypothetical protein